MPSYEHRTKGDSKWRHEDPGRSSRTPRPKKSFPARHRKRGRRKEEREKKANREILLVIFRVLLCIGAIVEGRERWRVAGRESKCDRKGEKGEDRGLGCREGEGRRAEEEMGREGKREG